MRNYNAENAELLFQVRLSQQANSHSAQQFRSFKLEPEGKLEFRMLFNLVH